MELWEVIKQFLLSILSVGLVLFAQIPLLSKFSPPTSAVPQTNPIRYVQKKVVPKDNSPWGEAKKIGEHTYTIKVGEDPLMATPREVLDALNNYRQTNGKGTLMWDDKLAAYAQERAQLFSQKGTTDAHAGFEDFLDNQDGFNKLGFNKLGENSYYGGKLYGVHLIEWIFAKSPEHNANQLDSGWDYVGIGISGNGVNLIFGGGKM